MIKLLRIIFITVFVSLVVQAGVPVFNVHQSTKVENFVVANIDSILFAEVNTRMVIHKKDGSLSTVDIAKIDSTVFAEGEYGLPSVEMLSTTFNYSSGSATCQVKIVSNGGCSLVQRGVCWSTNMNPTINDQKFASGTTVGTFYALMTGLSVDKTYYARAFATNCAGTVYGENVKVQPLMGQVTYTLDQSVINAGERTHRLIKEAMDSAMYYYNRYTPFKANIPVYYSSGIPTAQANYHGSIGFGKEEVYMYVGTAMHEMAHYFGSGTTNAWKALCVGGLWQGAAGKALCLELTGQTLKTDNNSNPQHYWPTGINLRKEVTSQKDLIDHARVVKAMLVDDAKLPTSW